MIAEGETFSYRTLSKRINQYARWALASGIQKGDTVCLLMPSRPDYIAAWLGIGKVGGVVALINTKLVGQSLAHCVNVARAADLDQPGRVQVVPGQQRQVGVVLCEQPRAAVVQQISVALGVYPQPLLTLAGL